MTAAFSLRQAPVASRLTLLLDQVEAVAAAIADNATDNPDTDQIDPETAASWHATALRVARIINPAS